MENAVPADGDNAEASRNPPEMGVVENDGDADASFDFSFLPETAWVVVLGYLPLSDQYRLSCTCHTLYDMFNHPSNWKSACLRMIGGVHNFSRNYIFMPQIFKNIVEKFGHYFQRLTISLEGHLVFMGSDIRNIIERMSEVCRLEHLVLEVGMLTSLFHLEGIQPFRDDLKAILKLVGTAFRMKKVEIISWPMFPEIFSQDEVNIFEALKRNEKLRTLQSLSLFGMKNKQWSQRAPLLPSPAYTVDLISHFCHLQHLTVRSPMLSERLMVELADASRDKLLYLQILLTYSAHQAEFRVPEISSSAWSALCARSPRLEVECVIMSRVPYLDLGAVMKPEVPLTSMTVLKYARCSQDFLHSLSQKFKATLRDFLCYTDPSDCGGELLKLVAHCPNLDSLVFHGEIHITQLTDIVKLRDRWRQLEFVRKLITTQPVEQFDDDVVIGQREGGDLVLVELMRFHGDQPEEERAEQLNTLCEEVSGRLGYAWKPLEHWQLPS